MKQKVTDQCLQLFSIALSITIQSAVVEGYGRHIDDLANPQRKAALRWFFIAQTPYKIVVALNKVSLVLLYMRIFISRSFKISAHIVLAVVISYGIAGVAATIFQCIPIAGSWDKSVDATCINSDMFWVANAILNILTDVMVLALPIPSIFGLQLKRRERFMLCLIFLLGGLCVQLIIEIHRLTASNSVTITSILRVTAVSDSLRNRADLTWNFITRGIWTLIEANAGIIGASLPIFKQPLALMFPRLFKTKSTISNSRYGNGSHPGRSMKLEDISPHAMPATSWKNQMSTHVTSVTGPGSKARRTSDEQHIMSKSCKGSDSGSLSV